MFRLRVRTAGLGAAAFVVALGVQAFADQASPKPAAPVDVTSRILADAPAPSPTPSRFTYSGYGRSFDFTRLNNPQLSSKNALNQQTWSTAISLHGAYDLGGGFSIGGTYLYADPFSGNCESAASHAAGAPCVNSNKQTPGQGTNPDDTVPGFQLSTLYETYLQYKSPSNGPLFVRVGDQVINTPWALPADTRLKPAAFRGADASYAIDKNWSIELMDMIRFEGRAESDFQDSTLLTGTKIASANYGGAPANLVVTPYTSINTNGFTYGRLGYSSPQLTANLHLYDIADIATMIWVDGRYPLAGPWKPVVAVQLGSEHDSGRAVLGKIDSQIYGIQGTVSPTKFLDFQVGYDNVPGKQDVVTLPSTVTCSSSGSITATAPFKYFLPASGTPQCHNLSNGQTIIYYGGWASPYTSGYTADQLFSTTLTTSMVDRAATGNGVQLQLTGYAMKRQLRLIARQGYYEFGNSTAGVAPTREFDADGTYFFNRVTKGTYKGLSLRYRYGERIQQFFATNPNFKYNRAQLEYDF